MKNKHRIIFEIIMAILLFIGIYFGPWYQHTNPIIFFGSAGLAGVSFSFLSISLLYRKYGI